ncbi:dimethylarginine dimethylaminohydrolase family protein [Bacillus sp. 03113]|uniref:dimethylarginine dimethylaminohydrolase family protein n=1 Tax=Bacillus sp. 03113 TaxID=2578211 RepID=UPI002852F24A|nr:dimethylarginine dimethylaminohydrolase family protein [Bacillus sp. 03113]
MAMLESESLSSANCSNEYNQLRHVIVCSPKYMRIEEPINETQKRYLLDNINRDLAMNQHEKFVEVLQKNGVEVYMLAPEKRYNEQVFTRDIGFCLGKTLFIGNMASSIRKGEESVFKNWLDHHGFTYSEITTGPIEGGDVIVSDKTVWVGLSERTSQEAVDELKSSLNTHKVIALPLKKGILHLDCVFNIVSSNTAIIYEDAFSEDALALIRKRYKLIEVDGEEQFSMGPNVLSLEPGKMLSLPQNVRMNEQLRKAGFHVIEVDFSEIIKSGGSFRCCSLPVLRM